MDEQYAGPRVAFGKVGVHWREGSEWRHAARGRDLHGVVLPIGISYAFLYRTPTGVFDNASP